MSLTIGEIWIGNKFGKEWDIEEEQKQINLKGKW